MKEQTLENKHRWETSRIVSVDVGDSPASWRAAGFHVGQDNRCNIGGILFHLLGDGGPRGVHGCTVEAETPLAQQRGVVEIRGLRYQVQPLGTAPAAEPGNHPGTASGIVKLEICPVETWATLTRMVHRVLPPPYTAFAHRNPSGEPQHVALWRMQNMEVFEMADNMGQTDKDEMAMFFLIVDDLDRAIQTAGAEHCSDPFDYAEGRKAVVLSMKKLNLSVRTFLIEPKPPEAGTA
jgi:hypothetical protein